MKKHIFFFSSFILFCLNLLGQNDTIAWRLVLIGDAGQLTDGRHPVVDAVKKYIPLEKNTSVFFLGDNLYKSGLPDRQFPSLYDKARAILDTQVSVADGTPAKVYMIPGNHDWENGGRGGYDAIVRQQLYVDFMGKGDTVSYYPKDGCPGPDVVNMGKDVVVIMFDSQWWLHPYDKPEIESDCKCKTKDELVSRIRDIALNNPNKLIVLACHHPFKSNGVHGGFFTLKQHIFPFTDIKKSLYIPLPILGSIYPISRSVFGSPQDLKHPNYANMINEISDAIKPVTQNLVFVSGHDHNLQYIIDSGYHYIVSGGGCKQNRTSKNKNSLFNSTDNGFAVLEVSKNRNVTISFYTVTDSVRKEYFGPLLSINAAIPETETRTVEDPYAKYRDSIAIAADEKLKPAKGFKKIFMGQNYRPEWSTPVKMKVFKISQEKGGFTNFTLGGGTETVALHMMDKNRKEWTLRSVSKNPSGLSVLSPKEGAFLKELKKEVTSASFPYSGLVFQELARPLKLAVPTPELFFVPDDPGFGIYRKLFANRVCLLEEKDPSFDSTETKTTAKIFAKMLDENDHLPDQQMVLSARLLDIITGDYDRHFDQWKWGTVDSTRGKAVKGKLYYPIPRDRDKAFFHSDGFVFNLVSSKLPFLKGFRNDIPRIKWLGYMAKDFDRIFLTALDEKDWKNAITDIQSKLTDSVINSSVKKLPPEIYPISGKRIADKMISRRNLLTEEGMKYYRFLSKKVNVIGSNQKEYFKVTSEAGGLRVKVYAREKNNDTSFVQYDRIFDPSVTREIRLYGLNDDDFFEIDENASSRIKIRIIGGRGNDTFDIRGKVETLLYDLKDDFNYVKSKSRTKNRLSDDPPLNERALLDFNYNTFKFPRLIIGHNTDDGWLIGAGFAAKTYGFRNYPYATNQRFSTLYAADRGAFKFTYNGEFNHITRKIDLLVNTAYADPELKNFFGLGNKTVFDQKNKNNRFYQVKYRYIEFETLLRKRFFDNLQISFGPWFQHYSANYNDNRNNILSRPDLIGLDSANIFSSKSYLGGKLSLVLDNRNNELFPTRGIHWSNHFVTATGLNSNSKNITYYTSDMAVYASLRDPAKLITVLRFGAGKVLSKQYEYFQAVNFGANTDLAGFRKNRFAGSSMMYAGIEMKLKLFSINSFILPGDFGITGFLNSGRVRISGESSRKWHKAFGGGFYFIPFNLFVVSATAGFSEEERMFNFTIGTRINLTY